jgi:type IV pilus assembly protein PilC
VLDAFASTLVGMIVLILAALLWLALAAGGAVGRSLSGEQGGLLPHGVMRHGSRFHRTLDLQSIVSRLALITRLNLPLCSALDAAAVREPATIRRALQELSGRLRTGLALSEALAKTFQGCPAQLTAALQRGERCGQLAEALAEQERMITATANACLRTTPHARHAVAYTAMMAIAAGTLVLGILLMVVPKFREIFVDFDVVLPGATLALIDMAAWTERHLPEVLMTGLLFVCVTLMVSFIVSRTTEQGTVVRIVAMLRWCLPMTRTLDFGLGMSRAIRSLTLDTQSGVGIAAIETLPSVVSPTNHLRGRLVVFASAVSQGGIPHKAAKEAKLGDVFVCALRMVERGEEPERALNHAADYYEAIAYRWWNALSALSVPLVTLAIGAMVGFVVLAMFVPLITLIDAVSGTF